MNIEELQNKIKMQESIIENLRNGLQQLAAEKHAIEKENEELLLMIDV
tara:strand:- start:96 stop:239 length:144 start_codon:yes stop_codon:yes gene_type:complete